MRVVAGLLIVLVTIIVYLRVRASKRREAKLAEQVSAAKATKNATPGANVK
jgi:hypothetical protein